MTVARVMTKTRAIPVTVGGLQHQHMTSIARLGPLENHDNYEDGDPDAHDPRDRCTLEGRQAVGCPARGGEGGHSIWEEDW